MTTESTPIPTREPGDFNWLQDAFSNPKVRDKVLRGPIEDRHRLITSLRFEARGLTEEQRDKWVTTAFSMASLPATNEESGEIQQTAKAFLPMVISTYMEQGSSYSHQKRLFSIFSDELLNLRTSLGLPEEAKTPEIHTIESFLEATQLLSRFLQFRGIFRVGVEKEIERLDEFFTDIEGKDYVWNKANEIRTSGQAIPHTPWGREPVMPHKKYRLPRIRRLRDEGHTFAQIEEIVADVPIEDIIYAFS